MTNFLTAAVAMSESPLFRFLAAIALLVLMAKAVIFIADVVCDDMVNEAALAVSLELATTDDDFDEYAHEAIAPTLPLAPLQAAAIAHAEAVRFDPEADDWTETTEEHR